MKYIVQKDKKKRSFFRLNEKSYLAFKSLSYNRSKNNFLNSMYEKLFIFYKNNFSSTVIKNRCVSTGRPRSVYRFGRISRIKFRQQASIGFFNGVRKASW